MGWDQPGVDIEPIQDALTGYRRATRTYEWRGAEESERTELLASLDGLTTARRERLSSASRALPVLYVLTLVASGAALIVNAGALTF